MLDHISVNVKSFKESLDFYDKTLSILGYERTMFYDEPKIQMAGYGLNHKPSFIITAEPGPDKLGEVIGKASGLHICFLAPDVESIKKWYEKCLQLGGMDNGAPGPRPIYHPGYYGAFITDPNGWRIEAVLHTYVGH